MVGLYYHFHVMIGTSCMLCDIAFTILDYTCNNIYLFFGDFICGKFNYQVVPSVAIGFTMYDLMKLWLEVPSRDNAAVAVARER